MCTGCYPEIYIVDARDLSVVRRLTSEAKPDWISAACTFDMEPVGKTAGSTEALLAVTMEGMGFEKGWVSRRCGAVWFA